MPILNRENGFEGANVKIYCKKFLTHVDVIIFMNVNYIFYEKTPCYKVYDYFKSFSCISIRNIY